MPSRTGLAEQVVEGLRAASNVGTALLAGIAGNILAPAVAG